MENTGKGLGLLEKSLNLIKQYKLWDFIKAFIVVFMVSIMVFGITNPDKVFEYFQRAGKKAHDELLEHRLNNTHKIQSSIERLMFKVGASRVEVLEMHNGNNSIAGIPFLKATATFEALDDDIQPIANQYNEVNLSLIPFATKLFNDGYWCGDTEDMKIIDKSLCYRMLSNNTNHFAAVVIQGVDKPIGFLFVSFDDLPDKHDCEQVKREINKTALEIGVLMEVNGSL